jgi:hypothetical protein
MTGHVIPFTVRAMLMIRRTTLPLLAAGLWLAVPGVGHAAPEPTPAAVDEDTLELTDSADERWGLDLGVQGDRQSSLGLTGAIRYDLFPSTTLHGSGHATDYRSDPAPGVPGVPRSLAAEVGVLQRFGHFGVDVAFGHWLATHVVKADELNLAGTYSNGGFSGGLRAGYRRATFAAFQSVASADFGTGYRTADVTASCRLTNTAFGVEGRWQGERLGAHATMMGYQYSSARCGLTAAGIGYASLSEDAGAFAALAGAPLSRLQNTALPVIGQQPALARSYAQLGVTWRRKDKGLSLDYLSQQDNFLGGTGTAYFATATAYMGGSTGIDVIFGRSQGGGSPRGLFGGLALRTRF